MNEKITNELIYETLKSLRDSIARIEFKQSEHSEQFIRLREDIHGLRGDTLRQERSIATVQLDVERINKRLGASRPYPLTSPHHDVTVLYSVLPILPPPAIK